MEDKKHCYYCGEPESESIKLVWDKHANSIRDMKGIKIQYESCWICPDCLEAEDYKEDFKNATEKGFIE